jgi:hypothetical protein
MIRALGMVAILLQAAFGQAPAKAPEFEVADIKLSDGTRDAKVQFLPGGRVDFPNVTVKSLIMVSYGVQENMITGGAQMDRFRPFRYRRQGSARHAAKRASPNATTAFGRKVQTGAPSRG